MWDKIARLLEERSVNITQLAEGIGVDRSAIYSWKRGRTTPKMEYLQRLADYFTVSISYFTDDADPTYYLNAETAKAAQELFNMPEGRALFDASAKATPEELKAALTILQTMQAARLRDKD